MNSMITLHTNLSSWAGSNMLHANAAMCVLSALRCLYSVHMAKFVLRDLWYLMAHYASRRRRITLAVTSLINVDLLNPLPAVLCIFLRT